MQNRLDLIWALNAEALRAECFSEADEIRLPAGGGLRIAAVIKNRLPLPHHAEHCVVHHKIHNGQPVGDKRCKLI